MLNHGLFAKFAKLSTSPDERLPQGKAPLGSLSWGKLDPNDDSVWQTKLDGAFVYYTLDNDGIRAYSWRRSKKDGKPIEHTEKLHGLEDVDVPRYLQGAVLQGEAWDPGRTSNETGAILNTRKEPRKGELRAALHGIQHLPGVDIKSLSNKEQIRMLKRIAKDLGVFDLPEMAVTPEQKKRLKKLIESGGHDQTSEGVVVYPTSGTPAKSVLRPTVDVPVVGITPGLGKHEKSGIGSLLVGSSDNPSRVGTGYTEGMRQAFWEKPDLLKGLVAKVEVHEVFPSGKFRGASFKGFHPEKSDPDALARLDSYLQTRAFSKEATINREEAIRRINAMDNLVDKINIEVRKGEWRSKNDLMPYPFTYGEIPELPNEADGDPWDVALMPGAELRDDLRVVGYIPSLRTKGNDKLLLGNKGKSTRSDQRTLRKDIKPLKKWFDSPVFFPKSGSAPLFGKCLKESLSDIRQNPDRKLMMGPPGPDPSRGRGDSNDTAHFWTEDATGKIYDNAKDTIRLDYSYAGREVSPTSVISELQEYGMWPKTSSAEFAPGIPFSKDVKPLPEKITQGLWEIAIQKHLANRAGKHFDLRLGDPETGHAHSWALPKATLPDAKNRVRLAVQQPTHTMEYMDFEGEIPEGYGAGKVQLPVRGQTNVDASPGRLQFDVPGKGTFVLRQQDGKQWMIMKKGSKVLTERPGEFSKHAASAIKPLLAAMLGVPLVGAAYGVSQHPEDPLKAMSGGAIGASAGAGAGAITGAGLMALLQYIGKTGIRPKGLATGAALGGLAGAALGAQEGAQAPVGIMGSDRDRLLAKILEEIQRKDQPEPWQPDLLR